MHSLHVDEDPRGVHLKHTSSVRTLSYKIQDCELDIQKLPAAWTTMDLRLAPSLQGYLGLDELGGTIPGVRFRLQYGT